MAPKSQTMSASAGTGFTNIDKYLGANKSAGDNVANAVGKAQESEESRMSPIDAAAHPVTLTADNIGKTSAADMAAAANQKWGGPASFDVNSEAHSQLQDLSNGQTTGRVLAKNAGIAGGQYNTKLNSIDQAIYGNPNAQSGVLLAKNTLNYVDARGEAINKGLKGSAAATDAAREASRAALGAYGKGITDKASTAAAGWNAEQASDRASGITRDPTTGAVIQLPAGQRRTGAWQDGTNAQAGNFLSDGDYSQLSNINAALGIAAPGPKMGAAVRGYNTTEADPGAVPNLSVTPSNQTVHLEAPTYTADSLADANAVTTANAVGANAAIPQPIKRLGTTSNNGFIKR